MGGELFVSIFILVFGGLMSQYMHYRFLNSKHTAVSDDIIKEFDELKSKVNALTIRAGFKL